MHVESGGFVTYALLPDAQKRVKGYKLAWRMAHGIAWRRADRFREPEGAPFLRRDEPHPPKTCWRLGRLVLFFDMTVEGLNLKELQALPPKNVVLCIDLDDLMNAGIRSTLLRLRAQGYAQGYGFVLRGAEALPRDVELCAIITCVDGGDGRPEAAGDAGHSVYCHTHGDLAGLHRLRARRLDVFRPGRPPTQAGPPCSRNPC